jgi:hypothetical protein
MQVNIDLPEDISQALRKQWGESLVTAMPMPAECGRFEAPSMAASFGKSTGP